MEQREIKFRALSVNTNQMVYSMTIATGTIKRKRDDYFFEVEPNVWIGVKKETIGQITKLKDKNEKELYFNDLVKINIPSLADKIFLVTKDDFGIPCFFLTNSFADCIDFKQYFLEMNSQKNDFEIIGNIHQDKHLLT